VGDLGSPRRVEETFRSIKGSSSLHYRHHKEGMDSLECGLANFLLFETGSLL
jgi:hypothetical protein